jgi:hypothetical protein
MNPVRLGFLPREHHHVVDELAGQTAKTLNGLIRALRNKA